MSIPSRSHASAPRSALRRRGSAAALACLLTFVLGVDRALPERDRSEPPAGAVEGGLARGVRVEHFLLEIDGAAGPERVGLLRWITRSDGDDLFLEWEVDFPADGLRVLAHERLGPAGARLVWRELFGGAGRTLIVEWDASSPELSLREWAREGTLRETRATHQGAVLPLYLLELAREGRVTQGVHRVLDPLTRALVPWNLRTRYDVAGGGQGDDTGTLREVELRRGDGTLVGRYRFRDSALVDFEWQEGGVRGRSIGEAEHTSGLSTRRREIVFPAATAGAGGGSSVRER